MLKIFVEIVLLTLLTGTILYGTLFVAVIFYYLIKYPKSSDRNIFGNYIGMKKEYKLIEDKIDSICIKKLPIVSYLVGFIYSTVTLLNL